MLAAAGIVAGAGVAEQAGLIAAEPAGLARVRVRSAEGERTIEGRVLVEAADGGVLLESADARLDLVQPADIVSREALPEPATNEPESAEVVGRRILAELPDGFELLVTRHYCICHDTSRAYAKWCAAVFERLHDAFGNYWRKAGFGLVDASRPLVVVIFADQERYAAYAADALGPAADRVAGYYDLMSNRVITYDLTGSDALRGERGAGSAKLGILASPAASGLVATLVHEATHQMAFNGGMHRRLAPVPLWVSEGIATCFETPDLTSTHGWNGIGAVNGPRMEQWRTGHRPGTAAAIVLDDTPFREAASGVQAYADAWALTHFLMQTRRREFVVYLRLLAAKPPLADDSPEQRRADFRQAFGSEPEAIEPAFLRFMARQQPR